MALDAMGVIYQQRGVSALLVSFAGRLGVSVDTDMARRLYREASLGRMSSAGLWEALGVPGADRDAEFLAARTLMPGIREFVSAIRREGVQVGCITNDVAEWSHRQRRLYGLQDGIGPWVVSAEVGVRKPAPEIYERFLAEAGCEADDCMFIDDTPENLDTAARLGFRTLNFPGTFAEVFDLITEQRRCTYGQR
ncbi:MAG: putative hydrolase of the superfamily [Actinomycetota bacterium]|nr:putative hydrolase of the superfamily [Actinomycetota bacterium]